MLMIAMLFAGEARAANNWCSVGGVLGRSELIYVSGAEAAAKEKKAAEVEMREPKPTPPGGFLAVRIERTSIDLANLETQILVVEKDGAEVFRLEPPSDVPEVPGGGPYWWNILGSTFPEGVALPVTVHAIDKAISQRCTWTIGPYGAVERVKPAK